MNREQLLTAKTIFEGVCLNPDKTYEELSNIVGYAHNTVRIIVKELRNRNLVRVYKHYPSPTSRRSITRVVAEQDTPEYQEVISTSKLSGSVATTQSSIDLKELEELRAFKERAIAEFPILGVEPRTRKAREVLAEYTPEGPERVSLLAGDYDDSPPMKAVMKLLAA